MGVFDISALASNASGKKHQSKLFRKNSSVDIRLLSEASNKSEKSETSDKQTSSTDKQTSSKEKTRYKLIIN